MDMIKNQVIYGINNEAQLASRGDTLKDSLKRWFSPAFVLLVLALVAGLCIGVIFVRFNVTYAIAAIGVCVILIILQLRLDELMVALLVVIWILVDCYLGFRLVSQLMSILLLFVCYLGRSVNHPWVEPRPIWLWGLFLTLTIFPAIKGALDLYDADTFYPSIVLSAFIMFWLGNIVAKDISAVRRVFQLLSIFATLIAVHTIIEATTGKFLFESARAEAALAQNPYLLVQSLGVQVSRSGSFLGHPNQNATFLALNIFLPLGLFIESRQLWAKVIYLLEILLILIALMFTYSSGSWLAVLLGILAFLSLVGRIRYSILLFTLIAILTVIAVTYFPSQVALQLSHLTANNESSVHIGEWQTALGMIKAYPLFGVGLGLKTYLTHSIPYMVPAQLTPLTEPDNTYLEWAAMAGVPVMLIFLLLLGYVFWSSWRVWRAIDFRYRPLIGGGIVALIALSIDSLSIDGWSGQMGKPAWLIAGLVTSPLLRHYLRKQKVSAVDEAELP